MPYCQKCGTEIPSVGQPCPQCGFRREGVPLSEESRPASSPQPLPMSEGARRGKRTRLLLIALFAAVVLALIGVGIFLAGGGSTTSAGPIFPVGGSGGSASSAATTSDPIEGRWSGTLLEVDDERAFPDPGDMDAVFKSDGTWLLTIDGKSHHGTWEVYEDSSNDFKGYEFRVLGRSWLASIADEGDDRTLAALSMDKSRSMCFRS